MEEEMELSEAQLIAASLRRADKLDRIRRVRYTVALVTLLAGIVAAGFGALVWATACLAAGVVQFGLGRLGVDEDWKVIR